MKKRIPITFISALLCFVLFSGCGSNSNMDSSSKVNTNISDMMWQFDSREKVNEAEVLNRKSITFKSEIPLHFIKKDVVDYKDSTTPDESVEIPYSRYSFADSQSNSYMFDRQNRLINYTSYRVYSSDSKDLKFDGPNIKKEDIPALLETELKPCIPEYEKFQCEGMGDMGDSYNIAMRRTVSEGLYDNISITFQKTGVILFVNISYCGLQSVSDQQKAKLKKQLDDYLDKHKTPSTKSFIQSVDYKKVDDNIVAIYLVGTQKVSENTSSCDDYVEHQSYFFYLPD